MGSRWPEIPDIDEPMVVIDLEARGIEVPALTTSVVIGVSRAAAPPSVPEDQVDVALTTSSHAAGAMGRLYGSGQGARAARSAHPDLANSRGNSRPGPARRIWSRRAGRPVDRIARLFDAAERTRVPKLAG